MEPPKNFNVINPFRKGQNIGRRTGKLIVKKRLKSRPEMDSFDEYLSESGDDQSINLSRKKQLTNENILPEAQIYPNIAKTSPIIILQTESQNHVSSAHKESQETDVFVKALNPYAGNGRYGRRTGKDILAGKTKLLSNGMENFSDFFSDTDVSISVHGDPYETNTPPSSSRESIEAINNEYHSDNSASGDTDNHRSTSQVKSTASSVQRSGKAKKLSNVISVTPSVDLDAEVNKSRRKSNNLKDNKSGTVSYDVKSTASAVQRSGKAKKLSNAISVTPSVDLDTEVNKSRRKSNNLKDNKSGTVSDDVKSTASAVQRSGKAKKLSDVISATPSVDSDTEVNRSRRKSNNLKDNKSGTISDDVKSTASAVQRSGKAKKLSNVISVTPSVDSDTEVNRSRRKSNNLKDNKSGTISDDVKSTASAVQRSGKAKKLSNVISVTPSVDSDTEVNRSRRKSNNLKDNKSGTISDDVKSTASAVQRSGKAKKLSNVISVTPSVDLDTEVNKSQRKSNYLKGNKSGTISDDVNCSNIHTADNSSKILIPLQLKDVFLESENHSRSGSLSSDSMSNLNASKRKSTRSSSKKLADISIDENQSQREAEVSGLKEYSRIKNNKLADISIDENQSQREAEVSGLKEYSRIKNNKPASEENEKVIQDKVCTMVTKVTVKPSALQNAGGEDFSKMRENRSSLEENEKMTKSLALKDKLEKKTSDDVFKKPEDACLVSELEKKRSALRDGRSVTDITQITERHDEAAVRSAELKEDNAIGLNFGGDMAGSVSKTDQAPSTQFFGIKKRLTFSKALPDSEKRKKESKRKISNFIMDEYFNIKSSEEMSVQKSTLERKSSPNLDITTDSTEFLIVDEPVVVFHRKNTEEKSKKIQKGRKKKESLPADEGLTSQAGKMDAATNGELCSPDKDKLVKSIQPDKRKQEKMAIVEASQSKVIHKSSVLSDDDLPSKKSQQNLDKSSKETNQNLSHTLLAHNISVTKDISRNKSQLMHRENSPRKPNHSPSFVNLSSEHKKSSKITASKRIKITEGRSPTKELTISVTKKTNKSLHSMNLEDKLDQSHDSGGLKSKRKLDLSTKEAEQNVLSDLNKMENAAEKSVTKDLSVSKLKKRKLSKQSEILTEELDEVEIPVEPKPKNSVRQLDRLKNSSNIERSVLNEIDKSDDKAQKYRNLSYNCKQLDESNVNEDLISNISLQEDEEFVPLSAASEAKKPRPAPKDSVRTKKLNKLTTRKALKVSKSKSKKKFREGNVALKPKRGRRKHATNDAETGHLEKDTHLSVKMNADPAHESSNECVNSEDVPEEASPLPDGLIIDQEVEQNVLLSSIENPKSRKKKIVSKQKKKIRVINDSVDAGQPSTPTQYLVSSDEDNLSKQSKGRKRRSSKKLFTTENKDDSLLTTPVHLNLLSTLPQVTPKSGISFRPSRQFTSILQEDKDDDGDKSMQQFSDIDTTPRNTCKSATTPRNTFKSPVLTSCLKDASSIRPRIRGRRVRISQTIDRHEVSLDMKDSSSCSKMLESGLVSMSDSPVHYAEMTTNHNIPSSHSPNIVLPDLSHKIVHPKSPSLPGLRRSKRTRVMRLNCDRGEGIIYRRDSTGFGLVVAGIQPSVGEAKVKAREEERRRKRLRRKMQSMTVPAQIKRRLSTHKPVDQDVTMCTEFPVINPETDTEVLVECAGRKSSIIWYGPELAPVMDTDPMAVGLLLRQPSFSSGELHMRPFAEKPLGLAVQTLVYYVISGKVSVTINRTKTIFETGDAFFIPRGNYYAVENLRRNVAKLYFVDLGHPYDNSERHNSTLEETSD